MKKLENKLLDLVAESISMSEFEHWLNKDVEILNALENDEFILEVCVINLNSRHSSRELESIIRNRMSKEAFLAEIILRVCQNILDSGIKKPVYRMVGLIYGHFCWDEDFGLMQDFYYAYYDIDMANDGYCTDRSVLDSILILARRVVDNMAGKT
ncbi:MAG: hypothetical protein AB8B56_03925, partial [Crocinitomicaceae bacterium]